MDNLEIALVFFALAFASEIVGTVSGFGSSVFFVPLAGLLFDFKTTLALTGILHVFSTSAQLFMFRKSIDWKLLLKVGVPSVAMVLIGAELNSRISFTWAELAMGLFLIAFAITFLVKDKLQFRPTTFNAIAGGAAAGFLAGFLGTGGAIRGATLAAFNLPKETFVGTSAGIDFGVDVSRTIVYLYNGYLDYKYLWYLPVLFVLAYAGAWIGKKILDRIPARVFKKMVLVVILGIGAFMVYNFVASRV